jgi:carboxypeptidase family protein
MGFRTFILISLLMSALDPLAAAAGGLQSGAPAAGLSGRVVEQETEFPVPAARVVIAAAGRAPVQTLTDRDGRYRFEPLEPGSYRLTVDKVGFVEPDAQQLPTIRLGAGQLLEVPPVALRKTGVIAGRLLDPQGEPLQDVSVRAIRREGSAATSARATSSADMANLLRQNVRTNDLGEFRLYGLTPGEYFLVASPQPFGLATGAVSTAMLPQTYYPGAADASAAQVITVAAGQTVVIDFSLFAASTFNVSGIVVDSAGTTIPGVAVTIAVDNRPEADAGRDIQHFVGAAFGGIPGGRVTTQTDSSGRFTIRNITSGAYYATAAVVVRTVDAELVKTFPNTGSNRMLRSVPVQIVVNDADVEAVTIVVPLPQ